jgi:pyruvyltransferase
LTPIRAYWWRPTRPWRSLASEVIHNLPAWARTVAGARSLPRNFGDELTPSILEAVTGRRVRWAPVTTADLIAVGSIIDTYLRRPQAVGLIWGSGLRVPDVARRRQVDKGKVVAVRGSITASALGVSVPLGDPGILSVMWRRPSRRSGGLLVPHFSALNSPRGRDQLRAAKASGFAVALPSLAPKEMFDRIQSSDYVLSNSLHALVMSDAAGVPALRLTDLGLSSESRFKYDDYCSAFDESFVTASVEESVMRLPVSARELMEARSTRVSRALPELQAGLVGALEGAPL